MDKNINSFYWVGKVSPNTGKIVDFNYSGVVYMRYGVIKHVLNKHRSQLSKQNILHPIACIKKVIKEPDYIGSHPDKLTTSIEFIKYIHDNHILVAIEADVKEGYIYVSSMYPITEAKLESRIYSERVKKFNYRKLK